MKHWFRFFINIVIEMALLVMLLGMGAVWIRPAWYQHQQEEKIMLAKSDIQGRLALAIELFHAGHKLYPAKLEDLRPYLREGVPLDPWGKLYQYQIHGDRHPKSYDLSSHGPDGIPQTPDDIFN